MSDYQFRGIVAVGNTRAQAVNRYRLAATCKGITCFVDPNNKLAFVSNSSADLGNTFNPLNGNIDLDTSSEALNDLQFQAKAGDVHHAYHHQCTAGCGMHIVFDEPSFVQHCPSCATALSAEVEEDESDEDLADDGLTDEELDDLEIEDEEVDDEEIDADEDEAEEDEDNAAVASDGDTDGDDSDDDADDETEDEEVEEDFEEEESEEDDADEDLDSDDSDTADEDESDDSEEDDMADAPLVVAASTREEAVKRFSAEVTRQKTFKATAGAGGTNAVVTAEYKVCASAEGCGSHIVGEVALDNCPREGCGKPLVDPEQAVANAAPKAKLVDVTAAVAAGDEGQGEGGSEDNSDDEDQSQDSDAGSDENKDGEGKDDKSDANAGSEDSGDKDNEASMSLNKSQSNSDEDDSEEDDSDEDDSDDVEIDLLEDLGDDVTDDELDVSYSAAVAGKPAWTAYVRGTPVAMATHETINPDHKDLFGTPRFGQVAHAASKITGVKQTLGELGFKGIKASLSVSKHVEQRVAALAAAREEEMAKREGEYIERLEMALATAAVGITRGFFEGQVNPVREQLNSALAGVGIRNPGLIVDNAMQASFEPFLRTVFAKGRDILSKPSEVQESLARSVVETAYVPKTYQAVAGAESEHPLDTRLAGVGTVVVASDNAGKAAASKTESAVATAAAASDDGFNAKLKNAVGSLGRR